MSLRGEADGLRAQLQAATSAAQQCGKSSAASMAQLQAAAAEWRQQGEDTLGHWHTAASRTQRGAADAGGTAADGERDAAERAGQGARARAWCIGRGRDDGGDRGLAWHAGGRSAGAAGAGAGVAQGRQPLAAGGLRTSRSIPSQRKRGEAPAQNPLQFKYHAPCSLYLQGEMATLSS